MGFTKTTGNNGYDIYSETTAQFTTTAYSSNIAQFCGKKVSGTVKNVSNVTSIAAAGRIEVSMDGTTWALAAAADGTFTLITTTGALTQGTLVDLTNIKAPYVRMKITFVGTSAFEIKLARQKNA